MRTIHFFSLFFLIFFSCKQTNNDLVLAHINSIKNKYAPDSRIALWKVDFDVKNNTIKGETDSKEAKLEFLKLIESDNIDINDSITVLPNSSIPNFGIVNNSVSNLRKSPSHSSELVSQAVLGTKLQVLKKNDEWYLVKTPEGYISWVDHGGFINLEEKEFKNYFEGEKVIFNDVFGFVFKNKNMKKIVSDLVMGSVLKLINEESNQFKVMYPDGRIGWVDGSKFIKYSSFDELKNDDLDVLISNAEKLVGIPYLWGGTSSNGFDCSGFTKTLYYMNGLIIPRDASQQIKIGQIVDSVSIWKNLKIGDLLFFGYKNEEKLKIDHVGMWLGNNKFVQASKNVRISSVSPIDKDYDSYHMEKYIMTRRIINSLE